MTSRPIPFIWRKDIEGGAMVPHPRYRELAHRQFADGEEYVLEPTRPRNMKSHSHFFARMHEIWLNLPESSGHDFVDEEHFRK